MRPGPAPSQRSATARSSARSTRASASPSSRWRARSPERFREGAVLPRAGSHSSGDLQPGPRSSTSSSTRKIVVGKGEIDEVVRDRRPDADQSGRGDAVAHGGGAALPGQPGRPSRRSPGHPRRSRAGLNPGGGRQLRCLGQPASARRAARALANFLFGSDR